MTALQKNKGFLSLKLFVQRLKDQLQIPKTSDDDNKESSEEIESLPHDVGEGQFTILLAAKDDDAKNNIVPVRFVVELCVLKNPIFLNLLKKAEEEYGFRQKGPLKIPCRSEDVRRIIQEIMSSKSSL